MNKNKTGGIWVASACVVLDKYRNEIESKCFNFIWDGKPDKANRNTMIGNFDCTF